MSLDGSCNCDSSLPSHLNTSSLAICILFLKVCNKWGFMWLCIQGSTSFDIFWGKRALWLDVSFFLFCRSFLSEVFSQALWSVFVWQWNILLLFRRHGVVFKESMRLQCVRVPHQVKELSFLLSCGQLRGPTDFWVSGRQQKKLTPGSSCPW